MLKIKRYYNQNKKVIWKITSFMVFLILLIQLLNYFVKNKENSNISSNLSIDNRITSHNEYSDLYVAAEGSVLSQENTVESKSELMQTINNFFKFCNIGEIDKAYNLLTNECKEELYPSKEKFKKYYYDTIFNGKKKIITLENWISNTYKVDISDNALSTGKYSKNNNIQDYITIKECEENQYKLNINGFIKRKYINKETEMYDIKVKTLYKSVYMSFENYTFEIFNNKKETILLDNLRNVDSMFLTDSNNLTYSSYSHELFEKDMIIKSKETKRINIKYYNKYSSNREIKKITFNGIILNYNNYLDMVDNSSFDNYQKIEIDL